MVDYEVLLDDCVDYISAEIFKDLPKTAVSAPVSSCSLGDEKLLDGDWPPLESVTDPGIRRDMQLCTFRKILLDIMRSNEAEEENEVCLRKLAVTLDSVHYLQLSVKNRETEGWANMWMNLYFDLAKSVIQFLKLPDTLLSFFDYFESRLQWYLQGQEIDVFYGDNKLSSGIRLPLSRFLYYCNEFTRQMEVQSKLNTPMHYRVLNKIQWFVSQLLPINENCNFNKSGVIMGQLPDSIWVGKLGKNLGGRSPSLYTDWNLFVEEFLLDPVGIMLLPLRERQSFEDYTNDIVDFIIDKEAAYYTQRADIKKEPNNFKNDILGHELAENFANFYFKGGQDSRVTISDSKSGFWKRFSELQNSMDRLIHPLPLELCTNDENAFNTQMETIQWDTYRKVALMQVAITCNMVDIIMRDDTIFKQYVARYKNIHFDKSFPSEPVTQFKIFSATANRIKEFYKDKDRDFYEVLCEILTSDETYMSAKVTNMSKFKEFNWKLTPIWDPPLFNYSFKKFGFIKLGNKKLNEVWKIESGLETLTALSKSQEDVPFTTYRKLQQDYDKSTLEDLPQKDTKKIMRDWQSLRSLRSQFLFSFNLFDETTGTNGLFNKSLIDDSRGKKAKAYNEVLNTENKKHKALLEAAENYFQQKSLSELETTVNPLKRKHEDDIGTENTSGAESSTSKRIHMDKGSTISDFDAIYDDNKTSPDEPREIGVVQIENPDIESHTEESKYPEKYGKNEIENDEEEEAVPEV
ncbi:HBR073Wp [Eremothecium sinecaudum]|uniref:HBR073Wp n=1 Tax=Eremothecium sinecaudum TaxID=45286 RepID=A0A120K136_9SACH|nr:HBR073Wp [Eremothecium sinecaudum]AMD18974.1 HBR073Wp [Eremothecium sinecaudum]